MIGGYRIHCRGARLPNKCPAYDIKQSESEDSEIMELWEMQITPSFPLLPGSLRPVVVAPDRFLPMGHIELNYVLILN